MVFALIYTCKAEADLHRAIHIQSSIWCTRPMLLRAVYGMLSASNDLAVFGVAVISNLLQTNLLTLSSMEETWVKTMISSPKNDSTKSVSI